MSAVSSFEGASEEVIGDYKIQFSFVPGNGTVRKALGPWPMRNWSWISFYNGSVGDCRDYIQWAARIDAGDRDLVGHASDWLAAELGASKLHRTPDGLEHLPKTWGYPFQKALSQFPKKQAEPTEVSGELLVAFVVIIAVAVCGFIYHSM